jgi:hypothetical protein
VCFEVGAPQKKKKKKHSLFGLSPLVKTTMTIEPLLAIHPKEMISENEEDEEENEVSHLLLKL